MSLKYLKGKFLASKLVSYSSSRYHFDSLKNCKSYGYFLPPSVVSCFERSFLDLVSIFPIMREYVLWF